MKKESAPGVIITYRRFVPYTLAVYIVSVAAVMLYFNMRLTIEWVAIILLGAALLSGRALLFVRDWGVFIAVLMAWQLTSPLATHFDFQWHLQELIDADKWLFFGRVPPLWLQQHLYHPGVLEPWDVFAATMYMLHFLTPLAAGFLLWMTNRMLFQKYALTFVLVAVAGFITYILYPAVPPWLAAKHLVASGHQYIVPYVQLHGRWVQDVQSGRVYLPGPWAEDVQSGHVYLPGVQNLFATIMSGWYNPYNGTIFFGGLHSFQYDNVAAIPSEHAMYPMLWLLFLRLQFGRWAYLGLFYIAGLLFSITYLGQHYMIDAIVGFAYAGIGYALVMHVFPALLRWRNEPRQRTPAARPVSRAELEEA